MRSWGTWSTGAVTSVHADLSWRLNHAEPSRSLPPLPGPRVMGEPDHRLLPAAADSHEPVSGVDDRVDRIAWLLRNDPVRGGERPRQALPARPDRLRALRHPSVRATSDARGHISQRGLAPARRLHRGEVPGDAAVRR